MAKTTIDRKDYYFTSWMDSKPVHGLSTLPTTKSMVQRKVKVRPDAPFRVANVPRPDMWRYYNCGMGGTDLHDQFNKYYRTTVRCNKWPIRIFAHFITSCVTNAYILYKSFLDLETTDMHLKDFILEMITEVSDAFVDPEEEKKKKEEEAEDNDSGSDNGVAQQRGLYKKRKKLPASVRLDNDGHYCRTVRNSENDTIRNRGCCRVCSKKVSTKCHKCDAFLCIEISGTETCFESFHK